MYKYQIYLMFVHCAPKDTASQKKFEGPTFKNKRSKKKFETVILSQIKCEPLIEKTLTKR